MRQCTTTSGLHYFSANLPHRHTDRMVICRCSGGEPPHGPWRKAHSTHQTTQSTHCRKPKCKNIPKPLIVACAAHSGKHPAVMHTCRSLTCTLTCNATCCRGPHYHRRPRLPLRLPMTRRTPPPMVEARVEGSQRAFAFLLRSGRSASNCTGI